ncbi:MAG: GGDEF domain-containing protein [Deltaproteobacteria bacterium CG_4_8_14_3_um_filter_45_9]|nr:MAG: GGDEF domain-containing protein [Deltaproteobacteria bacterium CG_4_8_14_3_um_filter_45_9]
MAILGQTSSHQKSENSTPTLYTRCRNVDWDQTEARETLGQTPPPRKLKSTLDSIFDLITEYLNKLHRSFLIAIAFVILASVGILNHLAGPDLSIWIFYLIPIFLVTWFTERWIGILMSIVSALTWLMADYTSGAAYLDHAIPYWNCIARSGSFLILTLVLSALKSAVEKEKELSRIDFLTGVGNSRYFIELADMEINRARRYKHPLTVANIDLDNFKTINDRFGHSTGDKLLQLVANTIKHNIRLTDTVSRVGGDEFAILLPETGPELAEAITRKVQKMNLEIMQKNGWPVTFSIGVVTFISPPSTVDDLLKISDNLMYVSKNNGKNTIKYEVSGIKEWLSVTVA